MPVPAEFSDYNLSACVGGCGDTLRSHRRSLSFGSNRGCFGSFPLRADGGGVILSLLRVLPLFFYRPFFTFLPETFPTLFYGA